MDHQLSAGYYPHKSVPAVKKVSSVQKEVAYCPGLQFVVFDIALLHQTGDKGEKAHNIISIS